MNNKKNNKYVAIILASGLGERFGGETPKQFKKINNKTVLEHTLEIFLNNKHINDIYVTYNKKHKNFIIPIKKKYKNLTFTTGENTRQASSLKALKTLFKQKLYEYVIIHDSVRPLLTSTLLKQVIKSLVSKNSVIPVLKINDSVKFIKNRKVVKNVERKNLYLSQTPQGFLIKDLIKSYNEIKTDKLNEYTDDAQIFIDAGFTVNIIKGDENNFKITNRKDFSKAANMINNRSNDIIRVAQGIDVHAFTEGKNFKLFGVEVLFNKALKAHSDGDVGVHAIIDSILGTIANGDIGKHFPDNSKKYKNINSLILLKKTKELLARNKGNIIHLDSTIICEKPKMNKYIIKMRKVIASILNLNLNAVSIKATTTEKLGFIGKNEGIAVFSIATVSFNNEK